MRRSSIVALVAVLTMVLAVPAGLAATKKTRKVQSTFTGAVIANTSTGGAVVAGTVRDPLFGEGAIVYRTTPGPGGVLDSTFTSFSDHGSFKGTARVRSTPQPDGSARLDGTGKVTKGTERYRGAKGSFTISDGVIAADGKITFTVKGTVRY